MVLEISVLGSVVASTGGREHPLGGPKQRGLLARLVMARGRSLPVERLVDELWDESPPRDPAHALQARISRLRSALPIEIQLVDNGYRIDPARVQTDAGHFERLCERGSASIAENELSKAGEHFGSALELWQGQAFARLPDIAALRAESVRLDKLRAAALADRIDLDLALGRSAAVIPELHALLEEHPFAERHWSQLMTALYCDGRVQEALNTFTSARLTFANQLGVEPSSELGRLHTGILQKKPPASLLRLPVAGSVIAAAEAAPEMAHLPDRSLTSNQPDILADLLRDRQTLLLTGPAGIGKTHLLRTLATRFTAQRYSAPLLSASPLSQAVPLGVFTGTLPEKWTSPAALIDHFTRHRPTTVLLVDNVDQLDDASLFVISQLVRNARVPTILTSRELANTPAEISALYDSGEIMEAAVNPLSASDADELVWHTLGGALTPDTRPRIFSIAAGNPLHLREILTASVDEGRLVHTDHGWELRGEAASTKRLTQLFGERFNGLDDAGFDAVTKIAIAGEYPAAALGELERRMLARAGVVEYSTPGWLRLSHPLDMDFLRARCSSALWMDLSREVLEALLGDATADFPAARRRAHILALDLDETVDVEATLAVAEHALGAFDERLALRAANAAVSREPGNSRAHRIAGLAASGLGQSGAASASFETARQSATTSSERSTVALAHAQHLGLRHHDAAAALAIIDEALGTIVDQKDNHHLQRDAMRWSAVAGQTSEVFDAPEDALDAVAALGLITVGASGAITGPLDVAERALTRLRQLPDEIVHLVPGGASLIDLIGIMVLSNTGDVQSARRQLQQMIANAELRAPESIGIWEYALAFSELLSGDSEKAYTVAVSSSAHLKWRDTSGLLPAALALTGAAAYATQRMDAAREAFASIPAAAEDPKVVMLRAWADAWQQRAAGNSGAAARLLVEKARWLLSAQHSYFAGMLAHCAVRVSAVQRSADDCLAECVAILGEATQIAGGGLLEFFVRHAVATIANDRTELEVIAREAETLGLTSTAADTWHTLARWDEVPEAAPRGAHCRRDDAKRLRELVPSMVLWSYESEGFAPR